MIPSGIDYSQCIILQWIMEKELKSRTNDSLFLHFTIVVKFSILPNVELHRSDISSPSSSSNSGGQNELFCYPYFPIMLLKIYIVDNS